MPFEEICQQAITTACQNYEVGLSETEITECSRVTLSVGFDSPLQEIERVVALEKRSHEQARVTHFKPLAALEAIASFVESVASIEFYHPNFSRQDDIEYV